MTPHYPLLNHDDPESLVSWSQGRGVTVAQFLSEAADLADRLPPKRHVVNLCHDRYAFLVGFAAALLGNHVSLLPNSRAAQALRQIHGAYESVYCLTDHADVPADIPVVSYPSNLLRSRRVAPVPAMPGDQVAAVVFTSGSTGDPTPHEKTWASLVMGAKTLAGQFGLSDIPARMILGTIPPQHMYGLETTVMLPLQTGWASHAGRPVFPQDIRADLREQPLPGWLMTTPLHLRACVSQGISLPMLEGIVSATMPLLPSLAQEAERVWGAPVYEIYGCTETGMVATRRTIEGQIWKVCAGLRIWKEGEDVRVSGGHVAGALRLADRITIRNDRSFVLHGRANDLIKVAGKRASLGALNAELTQIDGVLDGAFYMPGLVQTGGERLAAVAVAPGQTVSSILAELRKRIDPAFLPRPLRLVDALPRNEMGKLRRDSLRAFVSEHMQLDLQEGR